MDEDRTKEVLDFLLSSYRAKMAVQNPTENCQFGFSTFLSTWKDRALRCEETETEIGPCGADWTHLRKNMKQDLQPLIEEGIFDSIIPYLASSINKSSCGKKEEVRKDSNGIISAEFVSLTPRKGTSSSKVKGSIDKIPGENEDECEITIHVCDEGKNTRQDFKCVQGTLVQEMGYFSRVTVKGQKLMDMDISVHCDIAVFDWLMRWVKHHHHEGTLAPQLEASNVIGLMVSAEFLQMPKLTADCIEFTAKNIEDVIQHSPNLGCLNESLTAKLSLHFNNLDMEGRIGKTDKHDRITSRLYTQFILALNEVEWDASRGHYSSISTLFRCSTCNKLLINSVASKIPCGVMRLDCRGRIYSSHIKDNGWSLHSYIKELKRELKSWRKVYWRLWGTVHFLHCSVCQSYFAAKDLTSCPFHPKAPRLSINVLKATGEIQNDLESNESKVEECINPFRRRTEQEAKGQGVLDEGNDIETINCAFGSYPCCHRPGFKFYPLPQTNGCQWRDHNLSDYGHVSEERVLKRLVIFKDLILTPFIKEEKKSHEWGGIIDLTPPKVQSSSSINSSQLLTLGQGAAGRIGGMFQQQSSSTTEESFSDGDDTTMGEHLGNLQAAQRSSAQSSKISEFWSWNSDFTTRYNQDMQREREEKLMSDLEFLLSQRVSLEAGRNGGGINLGGGFRTLGYLTRRPPKNLGGSFVKLEEKWREEQRVIRNQRQLTGQRRGGQ